MQALQAPRVVGPVALDHQLVVGAEFDRRRILADELHQPGRVGEVVAPEGDHHPLRPGVDLLGVGGAAQDLDKVRSGKLGAGRLFR